MFVHQWTARPLNDPWRKCSVALTLVGISLISQKHYIYSWILTCFFSLVLDLCTTDLLHKTFWKCFGISSNMTNELPEVADFVCCKWICLKCCDVGSLLSRRRERGWNDRSCVSDHGGQTKHFDKALEPLRSLNPVVCRFSLCCIWHNADILSAVTW